MHIGETAMRLWSVTLRILSGWKRVGAKNEWQDTHVNLLEYATLFFVVESGYAMGGDEGSSLVSV